MNLEALSLKQQVCIPLTPSRHTNLAQAQEQNLSLHTHAHLDQAVRKEALRECAVATQHTSVVDAETAVKQLRQLPVPVRGRMRKGGQ